MWLELCSQAQRITSGCTASPSSLSPFRIDGWIERYWIFIATSLLDALLQSLASSVSKFNSSPLDGCYTLPWVSALGPFVCGGLGSCLQQLWCPAFQPWFLGSWVVDWKLQNGATRPPQQEVTLQWQGGRVSVGENKYSGTMTVKGNWVVSHKLKLPEETHLKSSGASSIQLRKLSIGLQWAWRVIHHIVHSGLHFCSKWSSSPILHFDSTLFSMNVLFCSTDPIGDSMIMKLLCCLLLLQRDQINILWHFFFFYVCCMWKYLLHKSNSLLSIAKHI